MKKKMSDLLCSRIFIRNGLWSKMLLFSGSFFFGAVFLFAQEAPPKDVQTITSEVSFTSATSVSTLSGKTEKKVRFVTKGVEVKLLDGKIKTSGKHDNWFFVVEKGSLTRENPTFSVISQSILPALDAKNPLYVLCEGEFLRPGKKDDFGFVLVEEVRRPWYSYLMRDGVTYIISVNYGAVINRGEPNPEMELSSGPLNDSMFALACSMVNTLGVGNNEVLLYVTYPTKLDADGEEIPRIDVSHTQKESYAEKIDETIYKKVTIMFNNFVIAKPEEKKEDKKKDKKKEKAFSFREIGKDTKKPIAGIISCGHGNYHETIGGLMQYTMGLKRYNCVSDGVLPKDTKNFNAYFARSSLFVEALDKNVVQEGFQLRILSCSAGGVPEGKDHLSLPHSFENNLSKITSGRIEAFSVEISFSNSGVSFSNSDLPDRTQKKLPPEINLFFSKKEEK